MCLPCSPVETEPVVPEPAAQPAFAMTCAKLQAFQDKQAANREARRQKGVERTAELKENVRIFTPLLLGRGGGL